MCQIKEIQLHAQTFEKMHNLRVLQFYNNNKKQDSNVYIPSILERLPDELRFLRWDGFPQRSLPLDFSPENLVKLDMPNCQLEQLWERDQHLPNLKRLDLSGSRNLIQIPDLSQSPNIEEVILSHCKGLVQVYSSSFLNKLNCIWLDGCVKLRSLNLPSYILSRSSGLIVLRGCCNLERFSVSIETMGVVLDGCSHNRSSRRIFNQTSDEVKKEEAKSYDKFLCSHNRSSRRIFNQTSDEVKKDEAKPYEKFLCSRNRSSRRIFNQTSDEVKKEEAKPYEKFLCSHNRSSRRIFNQTSDEEKKEKVKLYATCLFSYDPIDDRVDMQKEEPKDNIQLLYFKTLREGSPSLFPSRNELCWLDLSHCEFLTSLPTDFCKLKLLRRLYLFGCSNLEKFPEIEETMENLMVLILDQTAIDELPLSLHHLVGLEELSLNRCRMLEFIPPSIGSLSKLCKLDLAYCESLETLPSSIFKLKLTKLNLQGCLMLGNFPEILEPAESFVDIMFTKAAIKELPSSLENLPGLKILHLNLCRDLKFLPNSIGSVTLLSKLDFSGCDQLSEIPSEIGRLSLLEELSLDGSGIVNLPESIVHLSSLKSLDLSDCKRLECIPQLPPFLKQLLAFDCPSIRRVSNSKFVVSTDSKDTVFNFYLTNDQELDPSSQSNLATDAWLRIAEDAYRSVFYCFPGSTIPRWFPYSDKGRSVTVNVDSLDWCNDRFLGFAMCVVLGLEDINDERKYSIFCYRFIFQCDDGTHVITSRDELRYCFIWKGQERFIVQNHTFMWKCCSDSSFVSLLSRARKLTFEIWRKDWPTLKVKECGISPLFRNEKNDDTNLQRFSTNDIKETSGSKAA